MSLATTVKENIVRKPAYEEFSIMSLKANSITSYFIISTHYRPTTGHRSPSTMGRGVTVFHHAGPVRIGGPIGLVTTTTFANSNLKLQGFQSRPG
ncbi:jg2696 [Pararge aegeria aegeria]|uniref:Jg2696 protein n=1 Tax=Pararge aegeria aegeria TaxID=348720 RepID=A0A8S4R8X3_9NEOP|nr:jg2696 [Pararge aegeria aegeria]